MLYMFVLYSSQLLAIICLSIYLTCFFCDPTDVGNLVSGSSAFSKSGLYIWKFSVYVLLMPRLENFEYDLPSM